MPRFTTVTEKTKLVEGCLLRLRDTGVKKDFFYRKLSKNIFEHYYYYDYSSSSHGSSHVTYNKEDIINDDLFMFDKYVYTLSSSDETYVILNLEKEDLKVRVDRRQITFDKFMCLVSTKNLKSLMFNVNDNVDFVLVK